MQYKSIISYADIVKRENVSLQRGMNYRIKPTYSIVLMSVRKGAPYKDQWHEDIGLLEYEGHDEPRKNNVVPKNTDQPMKTVNNKLTENGKFYEAAIAYKEGKRTAETVQVYEKISSGVWCDQGKFELIDAKIINDGDRNVFRFFLKPASIMRADEPRLNETRTIPTLVKIEVWKRDQGKCVICGSKKNLHFDHDIPFSKGGSSLTAKNIRLLCAKHNLQKSDKIFSVGPLFLGLSILIASKTG